MSPSHLTPPFLHFLKAVLKNQNLFSIAKLRFVCMTLKTPCLAWPNQVLYLDHIAF
jgi:hypothetical protein